MDFGGRPRRFLAGSGGVMGRMRATGNIGSFTAYRGAGAAGNIIFSTTDKSSMAVGRVI